MAGKEPFFETSEICGSLQILVWMQEGHFAMGPKRDPNPRTVRRKLLERHAFVALTRPCVSTQAVSHKLPSVHRRCDSKTTTLQVCPICSPSDTTHFDDWACIRMSAHFQFRRALLAFGTELARSRLQHCGAAEAGSLRWHVLEDPRISKNCLGVPVRLAAKNWHGTLISMAVARKRWAHSSEWNRPLQTLHEHCRWL